MGLVVVISLLAILLMECTEEARIMWDHSATLLCRASVRSWDISHLRIKHVVSKDSMMYKTRNKEKKKGIRLGSG